MKINVKQVVVQTILTEAQAISRLVDGLDDSINEIISKILTSKGRVIATGIGKSAIIAQKFVATLNSTGTPAVFMHAADAIHGDLGVILPDDIVFCLSKSGNTPEIKVLVPLIKHNGNILVAIVSDTHSYLANHADYVIAATVEKEACPNNLAPTSSTTAQLVICDAVAVALLQSKGFTADDFAKYHPGGTLGRKLYMRVSDILQKEKAPQVNSTDDIKKVILEISSKRLGATAVVEDDKIIGIITDGDLRRMIERNTDFSTIKAHQIMSLHPKNIQMDELAVNAFYLMEKHKITQLIVLDGHRYIGMIHLHDLFQAGIV
ncbi:MAG TPA: KpsF/GutQ family sugar-phosphate isomerase [Bacteroidales bacterium]|jgi:arabinose-5-phosphate isomerase|nr:KpsF/GutQ family sugar-phosphate isomerase [Bacteroidales bacterium]